MNKYLLAGAASVSVLGLAASGGFTAANTMPATNVQGYGEVLSTGAVVTAIKATTLAGDASKVESVMFTTTTDVTTRTVKMTLWDGAAVLGTPYNCDLPVEVTPGVEWTITCLTVDNPTLDAYDTTGLSVY